MKLKRYILTTFALFGLCFCLSVMAQGNTDGIKQLQKQMYDLYSSRKTPLEQFMDVTNRLKEATLKAGDTHLFYRTWSNQALFHANNQRRNKGLQIAKELQEYALNHDDKFGIFSGTYVTGCILSMMGNYEQARNTLKEAIDYQHEHFPQESVAAPYLELAKIEYAQTHPLRTIHYADLALKDPAIEPRHQLNALSLKCLAIADTANYKIGAKEYKARFNEVYAEREKVKEKLGRDGLYGPRVECWRLINNEEYEKALEQADKINSKLTQLEMKQMIYKRMGDYKSAYNVTRWHSKIRDSVNSARNGHLLMEMTSALDMGRVELEAKELRLRNQQMQLDHIADELKQKQLTEEALNLTLKNQKIELENAATQLKNDSLEVRNKNLKLSEYMSKMEAQQHAERTHHMMMLAGAFIAVLTIGYMAFYLYRRQRAAKRLQEAHRQLQVAYDQLEEHTIARERMASELRIARDIQMGMVPRIFPQHPHFDLYAMMEPAKAVGGDLYDFFLLNDKLYFCIGDVSGKGIPASMLMAVAVNLFRTIAKEELPPEHIANKLNDTLSADNESGMFVTMFIGIIDLPSGRMDFCNAGHNPPLMDGKFIEMEPNAPIGLWPELEYVGEHVDNMKGKKLFLYTDGLNEAENKEQQQYGEDRLQRQINQHSKDSAQQTIEDIQQDVTLFVNGAEASDDMTILCLTVR